MRILVSGAAGFIGSHVARQLAAAQHTVIAAARQSPGPGQGAYRVADLAVDCLDPLLEGCDAVVHCAAKAAPWGERALFWRDNVLATERLLDAARRAGTVRRFVHISTPSIYFRYQNRENVEEAFTPPKRWPTHYAETKWLAECRVREAPLLGPVILRPRAVFGPGDRAIVPRILAAVQRGALILPNGGKALIDITYVENVASAVARALVAEREYEGRAFNITNGEPLQVRDMLTRLFSALNMVVRFRSIPIGVALVAARASEAIAKLRVGRPEPRLTKYGVGLLGYTQTLSLQAARSCLNYSPTVTIEQGLERYAHWWQRQ
jgi:nucleoside-diphosphate-sugar epimerase